MFAWITIGKTLHSSTKIDDDFRCGFDNHGRILSNDDSSESYFLAVAEEADLPDVAKFIVTNFGADAISLSQDLITFESMLMRPAVELVNGYSGIVAFVEVLAGLRSRLKDRFENMTIEPPSVEQGMSRAEIFLKKHQEVRLS